MISQYLTDELELIVGPDAALQFMTAFAICFLLLFFDLVDQLVGEQVKYLSRSETPVILILYFGPPLGQGSDLRLLALDRLVKMSEEFAMTVFKEVSLTHAFMSCFSFCSTSFLTTTHPTR